MKMNIHKNKMLWYNTRYCIRAFYERSWNMGKDFKGKEPGKEISQESTGLYSARFVEISIVLYYKPDCEQANW